MRYRSLCVLLAAILGVAAVAQDSPRKVTRAEALSAVASKVTPEYPNIARQLKIQGTVELEALVGETGEVVKVGIVSGNPVLTAPAVQAVKHWKFRPFMEDGKATRVLAPIALDFKL